MPLEGWPAQAGGERSRLILDAIDDGDYALPWCALELADSAGNRLKLRVSCDALKIDGVRVNVDAKTQQVIADKIGAVLLTPKIADEIYLASHARLDPRPRTITSSTAAMIGHSQDVDEEITERGASGLLANVGKDWVISSKIFSDDAITSRRAANYGWIVPPSEVAVDQATGRRKWRGIGVEDSQSTPSLIIIQDIGTAHDSSHTDYSQVARFAHRAAEYNGQAVDLIDVYTGNAPGTALVSHEGPLPDWRQPTPDLPDGGANLVPSPKPPGASPPPAPPLRAPARKKSSAAPVLGAGLGAGIGALAGGSTGAFVGGAVGGVLGLLARGRK